MSSREDRFEEAISDDISPSFNSILHVVTDTRCASQLTHVQYFHLIHFGDPIKSTTLSPFTVKEVQPVWWRDLPMLSQFGCGEVRFEITSVFL